MKTYEDIEREAIIAHLRLYMKRENIKTYTDLAGRLKIEKGSLSGILTGQRNFGPDIREKIYSNLGIILIHNPLEKPKELPSPRLVLASNVDGHPKIDIDDFITIPLLSGSIGAGMEQIPPEFIESWAVIHVSEIGRKENVVAIRITKGKNEYTGKSMSPVMEPGDIVAIDRNDRPESPSRNKIYAVSMERGATLKYVVKKDPFLFLLNENKDADILDPIDLRINPSPIIGRAIWCWKSLR